MLLRHPLRSLCLVAVLPLRHFVLAQDATAIKIGEMSVHVKDSAGHPLPAHGILWSSVRGLRRTVEAASDGSLNLSDLPFGAYRLQLMQPGFVAQTIDIRVQSTKPVDRQVTLLIQGMSTTVDVLSSTPIGARNVPIADMPVPVQTTTAQTIEDVNAINLTDVLKKRMNSVYVNENQNNPFQPDVNYRGYTASPLVGSPAGLSVYLDGGRQNQPFGDVAQWDLIPKIAIDTAELIPGSDPLYGLNTLGGAIAIQTKSVLSSAGLSISGYGGSFGRRAVDAAYGGNSSTGWNWFTAGTLFHEDGWRVQSPSSVRQSFAKPMSITAKAAERPPPRSLVASILTSPAPYRTRSSATRH